MLGYAQNTEEPVPANTILALMINPSYGAPAFVARLVPLSHLNAEFLYELVLSVSFYMSWYYR